MDADTFKALVLFAAQRESVSLESGERIWDIDWMDEVALVVDGLVGIYARTHPSENHELCYLASAYHWLGIESLFKRRRSLDYRVLMPVKIQFFDMKWFREHLSELPLLSVIEQYSSGYSWGLIRHIARKKSLKFRLLVMLLHIRLANENLPEFPLTLDQIADLVGTSKTRLSPLMRELEESSVVELGYRNYLISDVNSIKNCIANLKG
jgi:CRP-like cAMP-binding protein